MIQVHTLVYCAGFVCSSPGACVASQIRVLLDSYLGVAGVDDADNGEAGQHADEPVAVPLELEVDRRRVQDGAHQLTFRGHEARLGHHGQHLVTRRAHYNKTSQCLVCEHDGLVDF